MNELKRILVGIDLDARSLEPTSGSRKAAVQASWLARVTGGKLHFLTSIHCGEDAEPLGGGKGDPLELAVEAVEAVAAEFREKGLECTSEATRERAWLAITKEVLRDKIDLVIVAKRSKEQASGRKLGAVAVKLLRMCPCPVWVVKAEHDLVHRLILVANDLSPLGRVVSRYGAFVAKAQECELHVVHAYQVPLQVQMGAASQNEDEYAQELDKLKSNALERLTEDLSGAELDAPAVFHAVRSSATIAIREAVEHLSPDLLVMGMISRGGVAGLLVGDTAERLLETVDCSLLTLKPDDFICPVQLDD